MYNKDLYEFICNGNIEKSLYATCIFLIENSNIEILEETLIQVCSYLGSIITIYEIAKLNDIVILTKEFITNENIDVNFCLILITKMCILCHIYKSNPVSKTGIIPIGKLREKIIDVFNEDTMKLSVNGIMKFDMIIPPKDSEAYILVLKILSSFVRLIKIIETERIEKIEQISIKLRNCFDYIIRKKYTIETRLYPNEYDSIFFLWGFIKILYFHEEFIQSYYFLFHNNYKKSFKTLRIGLIHGCSISLVYCHKRCISQLWNQQELNVIYKTNEIANDLIKEVKKEIKVPSSLSKQYEENKNKKNGLDYIDTYIPSLRISNVNPNTNANANTNTYQEEFKTIYDNK